MKPTSSSYDSMTAPSLGLGGGVKYFVTKRIGFHKRKYQAPKQFFESNWDLLSKSGTTQSLFDKKVIFGNRRPKNLKDLLVRAKIPKQDTSHHPGRSGKQNVCPNPDQCTFCPKLDRSGKVTGTTYKREYIAKYNISCQSSNLIYCIHCTRCNTQYVGQTMRPLADRLTEHFRSIRQRSRLHSVSRHFNEHDHDGLGDVKVYVLDFIHKAPIKIPGKKGDLALGLRLKIEKNWIHRLRTVSPFGLNIKD